MCQGSEFPWLGYTGATYFCKCDRVLNMHFDAIMEEF